MKSFFVTILIVFLVLNICSVPICAENNVINIYVSPDGNDHNPGTLDLPFRTIEKAKNHVRGIKEKGNIIVNILSGEYFVEDTINFDESDCSNSGYEIVYRGIGDTKPLISGGVKVRNDWKDANGDGIYEIRVPEVSEARQLYVNGFAMQRARSDKYYNANITRYRGGGSQYGEDGFILSDYELPHFKHPEELEIVSHILWATHRMPVNKIIYDSLDDKALFIMKQPYYYSYITSGYDCYPAAGARIWIENALEFLDQEGEFYFDSSLKTLYYKPFAEDDLTTAEIYLPKAEGIMNIIGTNKKISRISFENLDFRYGAYNEVSEKGFSVLQSDCIWTPGNGTSFKNAVNTSVKSQIYVENAENINFLDCNFSCMGSAAIGMMNRVTDCEIKRNTIHDISATAVIIGSWDYTIESDPDTLCKRITVENNVIRGIGQEFMSSPAIGVYYARDIDIINNDIKDTPYTGITLGWGWGVSIPYELECGNFRVVGNRIEDTMCERLDGGAIYTLGYLGNSVIAENYIIDSPDNGAIYLDTGSASVTIRNNVFKNCARWLFTGKQDNVIVTDNYVDNNTYLMTENTTPGKESYVLGTMVYDDDNLIGNALDIAQGAGLSDEAAYLLDIAGRPTYTGTVYDYLPTDEMCADGDYILEAEDYISTNVDPGSIYIYESRNNDRTMIADIRTGHSYTYSVTVPEDREYNLDIRYTTGPSVEAASIRAEVYVNGELQLSRSNVLFGPSKGSWYTYPSESIGTVFLKRGENLITFVNRSDGWAFDNMRLTRIGKNYK